MKTYKIIIASIAFAISFKGIGQNILFKQTNKIMEYNYGIIAPDDLPKVTETEKIKYELKTVEKLYTKTINSNFESNFQIDLLSNEYEKEWMNLANKFKYNNNGMEIYDKNNTLIKTLAYTNEQQSDRIIMQNQIRDNGYHPGINDFPTFNDAFISQLAAQGIVVTTQANGDVKMINQSKTTIFNKNNLTIISEFIDQNGIKNRITKGYEPYLENKGYLLRINKHEQFKFSSNGPCITETKLTYYTEYNIEDNGQLVDKTMRLPETVNIYPNPNDGIFTATVQLNENNSISSIHVINVLTGVSIPISNNNSSTFQVNLPNLATGQYVLQVITTNQISLTSNFFKQ